MTHYPFLRRFFSALRDEADGNPIREEILLVRVSALICTVAFLWSLLYRALGVSVSPALPAGLLACVVINHLAYRAWKHRLSFRRALFTILLLFPLLAQCALGGFVPGSGLVLWSLLAPLCALLCLGVAGSGPWFLACLIAILSAELHDLALSPPSAMPEPVVVLFFALNFSALSILIHLSLSFAIGERNRTLLALEDAHARLATEQAKAERLLLNVLPATVADRLKDQDAEIAEGYPAVTVLFADIVNFTELAAHMEPKAVFALLNEVFGKFDELAEARGVEKIKTIGDAYMAAGGLNDRLEDPVQSVAELALDMRDWLAQAELSIEAPLKLRIGIGTGPVVAGVVGKKKFIYDLWGDTVNLAHRITNESTPGTLFCDSRTFLHLKYRFVFEDPVTLRLKGKGMVSVWNLLSGPKPAPSGELDLDLSL